MAPSVIKDVNELTDKTVALAIANGDDAAASALGSKPTASGSNLAELNADLLTITRTEAPRPVYAHDDPVLLAHETTCTDHMLLASWDVQNGWATPRIVPFGPLSIMPTASVLHYATTCFEGMKLYRGYDGKLRLFRPDRNMNRMLVSVTRIALPGFHPAQLLKCLVKLCALEGPRWLPKDRAGKYLYVRPTAIADDPTIGVGKPERALLYCILSYIPVIDERPGGVKLWASEEGSIRAWPGGFGFAKVGANYGPSIAVQAKAQAKGYMQMLWLFNRDGREEVTEAGASNFFVVWKTRTGEVELVTAPLTDALILDGVTRRSILDLARERLSKDAIGDQSGLQQKVAPVTVKEDVIDMQEIVTAVDNGRMIEAFIAGTAVFLSSISKIHYRGRDLDIPMVEGNSGLYAGLIKSWLKDIMYGRVAHEWGYVVDEH